MNTNLDMDWAGNQGLSDSDLMNISNGCGYDITIGANNGEEVRRANQTKPWPNDQEVNSILSESTKEESSKDRYLTFTVLGNKVGSISLTTTMSTPPSIQYSLDNGETWEDYIFGDGKHEGTGALVLNSGDTIKFKGNNTSLSDDKGKETTKFVTKESMTASGDVTSLLNGIGGDCELTEACFNNLFNGCAGLVEAPQLPATTLADSCYQYMFSGCTSLTQAPELPATTLAGNCYSNMFYGCTGLVEAPELPATNLANNCYAYMFNGCTSLTQAPELPAISLANYCYSYMFYNCTSLVEAPQLPATILANSCYSNMFNGCTSLNYIKCLATDISAEECTSRWVNGVSGSGTFVKDPNMSSWTTETDGIPSGWTVQDNV